MTRAWMGIVAGCGLLGGCGGGSHVESVGDEAPATTDWRGVATPADRVRLRGWRDAWVRALAEVKPADVAGDPTLFDPDRALTDAMPPAGAYRCRVFKLGARGGGPAFSTHDWSACRVDGSGATRTIAKTVGAQRPSGTLYADTLTRGVFLGTMVLSDERTAMTYGRDTSRDMAGLVERIGDRRWRLVLPFPKFESTLDVVEMVPAG